MTNDEKKVSAQTRDDVWAGKWDVDRLTRYYRKLADRHMRRHLYLRVFLLVPMSGSIASLLEAIPILPQVSAAFVAVFAIWDYLAAHERKATVATEIAGQCSSLEVEFLDLWNVVESCSIDDLHARRTLQDLNKRIVEITNRAGVHGLITNDKLNKSAASEASMVLQGDS